MANLKKFYDLLSIIVEKTLNNKCVVSDNNLLVKCDNEECSCSLVINTVFNNSFLQEIFLTHHAITDTELQQTSSVRKRKRVSQAETAPCNSLLMCDLIRICLKLQPQMIKVSCLRLYFDKLIEILTVQDFKFVITCSGK